ncbi:MAG TPA: maltose alpha-D-glucosyltransferase [Acidimicrobiia bacterium]|nr:maltose alpha-D-glucosyltransferase [Acidimicrobiia bacterium]
MTERTSTKPLRSSVVGGSDDPLWYKDAVIYEVHVRAFADSNGDGIGDFAGLTSRLDYLQDLGITALWLLPFYPSPLRDDGYDIANYLDVHPAYGTLADFRRFLDAAHQRGIRVITELVINHTSDRHPWFQRARRAAPGSPERDFYVWSDTADRYPEVRIIFQDTETSNWAWDPVAKAYYWHRFFSHQPDLNYDNPAVRTAVHEALDFWLDMGVDGLRLDAIPYLYEREGTNGENLPETHEELKVLRRHVDERYDNRMLLAEANQWPEDAVAYFGDGDECHMSFHFPLMPRLFMSIQMENRFPIIDILEQTPPIPDNAQWAIFLRNHDELTLEMVTEEEREFMYRTYAEDRRARLNLGIRRRLAPLLDNDRRKIELLNVLLYSLPGTPVLYYGDEIGMGDNIFLGDRNGVRTPMQWTAGRNAGFSAANPQELYFPAIIDPRYHYESVNVDAQLANGGSLLWWTRRMIALRKRHPVLGRGTIEFLQPDNSKVLAFLREDEHETLLVVANLSRFSQYVELDLSQLAGATVTELFGRTEFAPLGDQPYVLTLGPHSFYWFAIEPVDDLGRSEAVPMVEISGAVLTSGSDTPLAHAVAGHVARRSWYFDRFQPILSRRLEVVHGFGPDEEGWALAMIELDHPEGEPARYLMPLGVLWGVQSALTELPDEAIVATLRRGDQEGLLVDAAWLPQAQADLLAMVSDPDGPHRAAVQISRPLDEPIEPAECDAVDDSSEGHTLLTYGADYVLQLVRRLEIGVYPDLEMRQFLTRHNSFTGFPRILASAALPRDGGSIVIATLEPYVANEGTAAVQTVDSLRRFFETVTTLSPEQRSPAAMTDATGEPLPQLDDLLAPDLAAAEQLGQMTAALHLALASSHDDPAFRPEAFTTLYQRSLYQSLRTEVRQVLRNVRRRPGLPAEIAGEIDLLLGQEAVLLEVLRRVASAKMDGVRIRCHGDYRLDEVLFTGSGYVVFDFAGDTSRPMRERRIKASPMRDLAEMLRSFDYAAHVALRAEIDSGVVREDTADAYRMWADLWRAQIGLAFLDAYLEAGGARLVPSRADHRQWLLDGYTAEKAVHELRWEVDHRPHLADVPLAALLRLIHAASDD